MTPPKTKKGDSKKKAKGNSAKKSAAKKKATTERKPALDWRSFPIDKVAEILKQEAAKMREPIVTVESKTHRNPYRVLISTVISLRTKDETTAQASARLYKLADTPEAMMKLAAETIEKAIYPAGFYKTKAKNIIEISKILVERFEGKTPEEIEVLLTLPGVGRKTANLVRTLGHGKDGICVDTHVHRINNRFGWIATKTPEETEMRLREILPKKYWTPINDWLVAYGQHLCKPISPFCSKCKLSDICAKVGVEKHR